MGSKNYVLVLNNCQKEEAENIAKLISNLNGKNQKYLFYTVYKAITKYNYN